MKYDKIIKILRKIKTDDSNLKVLINNTIYLSELYYYIKSYRFLYKYDIELENIKKQYGIDLINQNTLEYIIYLINNNLDIICNNNLIDYKVIKKIKG